jgi:tetratricopeptide (TPR) repeat protein
LFNYAILGNGARPAGYHVINLLLHALNVALAYGVVRRVARDALTGALAAAVFALHPIATEAVTNVAGRADLLATLCVLVGLLLHIESTRRANPWRWRVGLLATTLLGAFAKESAVVVVAAILLYDGLAPSSSDAPPNAAATIRARWTSYAAVALAVLVVLVVRQSALADMGYYRDHFLDNPLFGLSFVAARLTALRVMAMQLWRLVWPASLSCDYSYDAIPLFGRAGAWQDAVAVASTLFIVALVAIATSVRRRHPAVTYFALFYFAALLPTSNLVVRIGSIMAERFLYLPSFAFAAVVALLVRASATRWALRRPAGPAPERLALAIVGALAVVAAARTYARNRDWQTEEALFDAARRVVPRSYKVHKGIANALLAEKPTGGPRLDQAIVAAEEGMRIIDARPLEPIQEPSDLMAALGLAYVLKGDSLGGGKIGEPPPPAAADWYRRAVRVLERAVRTDQAVNARVKALKLQAGSSPEEVRDVGLRRVHGTLGNAQMRLGDYAKALETFTYLRRLDPTRVDGYTQSAWALSAAGRLDDAAVLLIEATWLDGGESAGGLLRDIYRQIDPHLNAFDANNRLDVRQPRLHAHVERACQELVPVFLEVGRAQDAAELREACISRYGVPAQALGGG